MLSRSDRLTFRPLTPRETGILQLLAEGLSYKQIARSQHVARPTIKAHVERIYRKLGVHNAAHAVATGYRLGIIGASGIVEIKGEPVSYTGHAGNTYRRVSA